MGRDFSHGKSEHEPIASSRCGGNGRALNRLAVRTKITATGGKKQSSTVHCPIVCPGAMNKLRLPESFFAKLRSVCIDPAFLFRKSGLAHNLCSPGDGMISTEQLFRLWHTLGEISNDPATGLRMATLNPPGHPSNIAAYHARTFGDALPHLARSTARYFSEHMRIVKTKKECSIGFTGALLNEGAPALFLDLAFALVLDTGRRGTQWPLRPLRVELTRTSRHQEIYEAHFGCPVRLRAHCNQIVFRTDDLELPFATYNPELLARLNPQIDREIVRRKTQQTTCFRAKWVLKRLLGGEHTDIHEVAKELKMSSRTLQRRIAEEGNSFRQLLSDARRELARLYLLKPSLGLSQAASLLGYENSNSFLRAFRAWEGVTPTEWRAMQKAGLQEMPEATAISRRREILV
jgi:AraC-like DNA-binding protein